MNIFPSPQIPVSRPRPSHKQVDNVSRDSNTLRASVLETALELGIGSNSLVADWMFNNAVTEEEGDENEVGKNTLTLCSIFIFSFGFYQLFS